MVIGEVVAVIVVTSADMNGYLYRAIFTNRVGSVITNAAALTVQADAGGGN